MGRKDTRLEKKEEDCIRLFQQRCLWLCHQKCPHFEKTGISKSIRPLKSSKISPLQAVEIYGNNPWSFYYLTIEFSRRLVFKKWLPSLGINLLISLPK